MFVVWLRDDDLIATLWFQWCFCDGRAETLWTFHCYWTRLDFVSFPTFYSWCCIAFELLILYIATYLSWHHCISQKHLCESGVKCVFVFNNHSGAVSATPDASLWSASSLLSSSASLPLGLLQHADWLWTHPQRQTVCCWGETLITYFLSHSINPLAEAEKA